MKAIRVSEFGGPEVLKLVDMPDPPSPQPGEVLVRVKAAGVSLALQPLVENAIKHGFSVDSAAGRLEIAAKRDNGRVSLSVRDDGPGPAPGARPRFGVGLSNVQSRLQQLYGNESSLELTAANGRGCEAIITIPLRSSREDSSPHR